MASSGIMLDLVDLSTRSIDVSLSIPSACADELAARFDVPRPQREFIPLESEELAWLRAAMGIDIEKPDIAGVLRGASWLDDLPYELHTGRELRLMLKGKKPLAVFFGQDVESDPWIFPEDVFTPWVERGRLVQRVQVLAGVRRLLYALPAEGWRIDAYLKMWDDGEKCGWNDEFERREGELLGYEQWQIEYWLKARKVRFHAAEQHAATDVHAPGPLALRRGRG